MMTFRGRIPVPQAAKTTTVSIAAAPHGQEWERRSADTGLWEQQGRCLDRSEEEEEEKKKKEKKQTENLMGIERLGRLGEVQKKRWRAECRLRR